MKRSLFTTLLCAFLCAILAFSGAALTLEAPAYAVEDAPEAEASLSDSDLGELVFSIDFEDVSAVTNGGVIGKTTAAFGSQNILLYSRGMNMTYGIATPAVSGATKMLSMAATDYHGCVAFQNFSLTAVGTYTLTYDRYYASNVAYQSSAINAAPSTAQAVHASPTIQHMETSYTAESIPNITYVMIQFAKYQSGSTASPVYIDNVKLYYKAPGQALEYVNVMYGDDLTDIAATYSDKAVGDSITLPTVDEFRAAGYIPQGKYLAGFTAGSTCVKPGASYTIAEEDASGGIVYIFPDYRDVPDTGYGDLIAIEDYEETAALTRAFVPGGSGLYAFGSGASFSLATPSVTSASQMLAIDAAGTTGPHVGYTNFTLADEGVYTVVYDYYMPADHGTIGWFHVNNNVDAVNVADFAANKGTLVKNAVAAVTVTEGESFKRFGFQRYYYGNAVTGTLYVDNLRLYFKAPVPVTVTIYDDAAGTTAYSTDTFNVGDAITLPTVAAFAAYVPVDHTLAGFAVGGTTYAPGTSYTLTDADGEAGTLSILPVFEEMTVLGCGDMILGETFETYAENTVMTYYLTGAYKNLPAGITGTNNFRLYGFNDAANVYTVKTVDGEKMLELHKDAGNPAVAFAEINLDLPGVYTVLFDYYIADEDAHLALQFSGTALTGDTSYFTTTGMLSGAQASVVVPEGGKITQIRVFGYDTDTVCIDNIAVYYQPTGTPETLPTSSIRTDAPFGIRYLSFISTARRNASSEYGYLIARKEDGVDYDEALVLADGERVDNAAVTNAYGVKYISSANYVKNTKDIIYALDDSSIPAALSKGNGGVYFSAVATNIPTDHYHTVLVVRPFVKLGSVYYYGETYEKSLYDAAVEMRNAADYVTDETIEQIVAN